MYISVHILYDNGSDLQIPDLWTKWSLHGFGPSMHFRDGIPYNNFYGLSTHAISRRLDNTLLIAGIRNNLCVFPPERADNSTPGN